MWHVALQHNGFTRKTPLQQSLRVNRIHEGVAMSGVNPRLVSEQPRLFQLRLSNAYGLSAETDTNSLGLGGHHVWIPREKIVPAPPVTAGI